jgi:hypothetical protein
MPSQRARAGSGAGRGARRTPRKAKPHGEQAIYAGSELLGFVSWRAGYSHARSPAGRLIGKFLHANDAMAAVRHAAHNGAHQGDAP